MTTPAQPSSRNPILVVDRIGLIGESLVKELSRKSQVVFVTQKNILLPTKEENIVLVPYLHKVPKIPDNIYSQIFIIDDGQTSTRDALSSFTDKAVSDKAEFFFITNLFQTNDQVTKKINSFYKKVKVIIYGDIFGKDIIGSKLNFPTTINKFIYQAIKYHRIEIEGDGFSKTYPVFFDDVISNILIMAFGSEKNQPSGGNVFFLFPKHASTELSLAHAIRKSNPMVGIDFVKANKNKKDIKINTDGEYLLGEKYNIAEKIRKLDLENKSFLNKENEKIKFDNKNNNFLKWLFWIIFTFIILPIIVPIVFYLLGNKLTKYGEQALENGGLGVENAVLAASVFFRVAEKSSLILSKEVKFIGRENSLAVLSKNISSGEDESLVLKNILDASKIYSKIIKGESNNPKEEFIKSANLLKDLAIVFRQLETNNFYQPHFINSIKSIYPLIDFASSYDIFPEVFGVDHEKTYLVLIENNTEIRPSGGIIDSYGLLTLDKGKLKNFSVHDLESADSKLKGHIEPPYPLKKYLPSVHWYLRDSNFDPDFLTAASSAANFINLEIGKRVDGVLAIDAAFIKNVLSVIGPVYLIDYKKNIDANNFLTTLEANRDKKDFLRAILIAIQLKLSSSENINYFSLAKIVGNSIAEKHLLFAFNDKKIQDIFTINNWSGSLSDQRKESPNVVNDFLEINEANLGKNNANYYIQKSINHTIKIGDDGGIMDIVKISYKNTSTKSMDKDYKNYLRIILPFDSKISDVAFDGVSQKGIEIEKKDEGGKTTYGFFVVIPSGESKTITISYSLPTKVFLSISSFSYFLLLLKQSGADSYPYSFSMYYPEGFGLISSSNEITKGDGQLNSSFDFKKDINFKINFAKK